MARYISVIMPEDIANTGDADGRGIVDTEPTSGGRILIARVAGTHVGIVTAALNAYTPPA